MLKSPIRILKNTSLLLLLLTAVCSYAQTGTIGNPFTSLNQGATVTSAGIYYFNIGGNSFNTYVNANGYVQIAIDFGNGSGDLLQSNSLNNSTRGILNTSILAALTETQEVRISSNSGNFDVTTTNTTIISKIKSNTTLHKGPADNASNNDWVGTNASLITADAGCNTGSGSSLHQNIVHPCGNGSTFHWIPSGGYQRENWNIGEVANTTSFQLWVKGSVILPIHLLNFKIETTNFESVKLIWQTATETNNDYFTIEKSINGIDWSEVKRIDGAGNSFTLLNYSIIDENPFTGISYYRLKQTDFDKQFTYSQVKSAYVNNSRNSEIETYFNSSTNKLNIYYSDDVNTTVFSTNGIQIMETIQKEISFEHLPKGIYMIHVSSKNGSTVKKIVKD